MRYTVKVEGLSDTLSALRELPKATQKNTLARVLKQAGQPILDSAKQKVPVDTGKLRDSIAMGRRARYTDSQQERQVIAIALSKGQPAPRQSAMSAVWMYIGPIASKLRRDRQGKRKVVYSSFVEFGTANTEAKPYMRPAWEENKDKALEIIKDNLWTEIKKSADRLARKTARLASKG